MTDATDTPDPADSSKGQDPRVERLRPDPSQPTPHHRTMVGFWGDSDRAGRKRLYLTTALDSYAEFRAEDVLATVDVPEDQPPFVGERATRVELRADADVEFTRSLRLDEIDEFDLDIRFGPGARFAAFKAYASSGERACVEPGKPISDPCGMSCDAFLCKTFKLPEGGECCVGGSGGPGPGGGGTRDSCQTCGTCYSDVGHTACGTCYSDVGHTACGTCYSDVGRTQCGTCYCR